MCGCGIDTFRDWVSRLRVQGSEFGVHDLDLWLQVMGLTFRVRGVECRVQNAECRIQSVGPIRVHIFSFKVHGAGSLWGVHSVQGSEFRVR
jgi:hypothetical protein